MGLDVQFYTLVNAVLSRGLLAFMALVLACAYVLRYRCNFTYMVPRHKRIYQIVATLSVAAFYLYLQLTPDAPLNARIAASRLAFAFILYSQISLQYGAIRAYYKKTKAGKELC